MAKEQVQFLEQNDNFGILVLNIIKRMFLNLKIGGGLIIKGLKKRIRLQNGVID